MKIRKTFQGEVPENKILNNEINSNIDTYSCNYINKIIECGSNEKGEWIKYSNGKMICYGRISFTNIDIKNNWGNVYETPITYNLGTYPQTFIEIPYVVFTQYTGHTVNLESISKQSGSNIGETWFWSVTQRTAANFSFNYIAIGNWK